MTTRRNDTRKRFAEFRRWHDDFRARVDAADTSDDNPYPSDDEIDALADEAKELVYELAALVDWEDA